MPEGYTSNVTRTLLHIESIFINGLNYCANHYSLITKVHSWPHSGIGRAIGSVQFSSIAQFSHVQLFVTPWTAACQASLSITNSESSLKLISIKSVMPSNHLIQPVVLEVWKNAVKFLIPGGRQRSISLQHSSLTTPFFSALNLPLQDCPPCRKSLPENSQVKGLWGYFIDFWLLKIEAV